jgi:hypothetical protein
VWPLAPVIVALLTSGAACSSRQPLRPPTHSGLQGLKECGSAALFATQLIDQASRWDRATLGGHPRQVSVQADLLLSKMDAMVPLRSACLPFSDSTNVRVLNCFDAVETAQQIVHLRLGSWNLPPPDALEDLHRIPGAEERFHSELKGYGPFSE